uniref:Uncharacterized protein n=1 Tax=Podarcis muralis TaxID=64176 RepID=A0A670IHT9_PODMU
MAIQSSLKRLLFELVEHVKAHTKTSRQADGSCFICICSLTFYTEKDKRKQTNAISLGALPFLLNGRKMALPIRGDVISSRR